MNDYSLKDKNIGAIDGFRKALWKECDEINMKAQIILAN